MSCIWHYKINPISPTGWAWPEKFGLGRKQNSLEQHHEETQNLRKFSKRNCLKDPFGWRLLQAAEVWRTPERLGLVRGTGRGHQLFVCGRQLAPQPAQSTISPVLFRFSYKDMTFILARALTAHHALPPLQTSMLYDPCQRIATGKLNNCIHIRLMQADPGPWNNTDLSP